MFTPIDIRNEYINNNYKNKKGFFAVPLETKKILNNFDICNFKPEYVVIGDLDEEFTYKLLNKILKFIFKGSDLIVFHRNSYYIKNSEKYIDIAISRFLKYRI